MCDHGVGSRVNPKHTLRVMRYNMFYSSSVNILLAGIASTGARVLRCLGVLRDRPVVSKSQ
ncbi:hypothetical protein E2C01_081331 [Portunus trituberculatus]|uniref:Uncharacterized protein n=1 Tax=Portunus trituberculatus TaxID=210409 RepID=A0A5B7ILY8_PORTR|nr:hypothetical protein [Portunus trituberculatus]